jgi:hypothetical protein
LPAQSHGPKHDIGASGAGPPAHDTSTSKQTLDQFEQIYAIYLAERDRLEKVLVEVLKWCVTNGPGAFSLVRRETLAFWQDLRSAALRL